MATAKFTDTFTDTNGTALLSHSPEVGGPWEEGLDIALAEIQSNELVDSSQPANNDLLAYAALASAYAVGDEQWMDCTSRSIVGNGSHSPLMLVLVDNEVASTDISAIVVYAYKLSGDIEIHVDNYLKGTGFVDSAVVATGVVWPDGTDMRLGITLTSLTTYDIWIEPAGGGTRTTLGSYVVPSGFDFITAGGHDKCGIWLDNNSLAQPPEKLSQLHIEAPDPERCFSTDYTCASASPVVCTDVEPTSRIVLDDGCIPEGTLESY